jgi:hypothetical protein
LRKGVEKHVFDSISKIPTALRIPSKKPKPKNA